MMSANREMAVQQAVAADAVAAGKLEQHQRTARAAPAPLNGKALIWNDPASPIISLPVFFSWLPPPWGG
jgi:hypothetical protein